MSVRLMADVLEHVHDLTSGQKLLLVCLANYANEKGECWPSISTLAAQVDMSPRHVSGMLHELVKHGYLAIFEHTGKSNSYRVSVALPTNHSSWVQPPQPTNHSSSPPEPQFVGTPDPEFVGPLNHSSSPLRLTVNEPSTRTVKEPSGEKPQKKATRAPDVFEITEERARWGEKELGLDRAYLERETAKFLDFHRGKGTLHKEWGSAWKYWMRRAVEYRPVSSGAQRASPKLSNYEISMANIRAALGEPEQMIETTGVLR